jgi:hypothetical protein
MIPKTAVNVVSTKLAKTLRPCPPVYLRQSTLFYPDRVFSGNFLILTTVWMERGSKVVAVVESVLKNTCIFTSGGLTPSGLL